MRDKKLDISRLIDNELDHSQSIQLFHELQQEKQLNETYRRYEVVSQTLKNENYCPLPDDFVASVSQKLESEATYFLPKNERTEKNYFKLGALAASLALFTVFAVQNQQLSKRPVEQVLQNDLQLATNTPQQPENKTTTEPENTATTLNLVAGSRHTQKGSHPTQYPQLKPVSPRFNAYLQAHTGNLYSSGANVQAYAQVAGYE